MIFSGKATTNDTWQSLQRARTARKRQKRVCWRTKQPVTLPWTTSPLHILFDWGSRLTSPCSIMRCVLSIISYCVLLNRYKTIVPANRLLELPPALATENSLWCFTVQILTLYVILVLDSKFSRSCVSSGEGGVWRRNRWIGHTQWRKLQRLDPHHAASAR